MKKILATAALMIAASTSALATVYGEVGLGQYQERADGMTLSQNLVRGIVGKELTKNIAVEGHLATSINSIDNFPDTGINHSVGLFAKFSAPVTDQFTVFGRVGVTQTNIKVFGVDSTSSRGAYGVGTSYAFNKKVAATADYTQYTNSGGGGVRMSTIMAGVNYKF